MAILSKAIGCYRNWRYGGVPAARRFLDEFEHNHAHVLATKPPVVYLWWGCDDGALHEELRGEKLTVLYLFPWYVGLKDVPEIARQTKERLGRHPNHRVLFLCNEEFLVEPLRKEGVEASFVNQNAFINENIFRPMAREKTHDAVYSASLSPYKRHHLAREIQSLMLLAYAYSGTTNAEYQKKTREELAHAWWAKDSTKDSEKFPVERMVELYNQACVGLCLSEIEGGMFASMEYLMCGLPIVTTRSVGGRDAFWTAETVIVADDDAGAIARAVAEMKGRALKPERVREVTMARVQEHRARLRGLLGEAGAKCVIPWEPGSHGITSFSDLRKLGRQIRTGSGGEKLP